ncbi:MAG: Stk1 family PASTA domain-containing Ser/Thr kinase [Acidimicrobiales bacterium]
MTSSEPSATPAPVVLGGRYEVHRRLARGGMAEVFLARDQALDRPVAVKILFPEFAADPAFVERFRREAQAAANLSHPNIVGVYDWGTESGTYYIVMEYVEGQSLAEVVRDAGPLHPRRAAEVIFEVAGALGFAHQRGVVHRDVKPGNVLISTSGVAKVTDFGIARALSSPADDLTQAGSVMGTATYFSPEQAQGFQVDARSDLYSLGVVLYEVLCGRPPFVGDSPVAIAYKHVQEWPPRPSQFVTGVPVGLESVILKLLAKKPEQRYRSADDLRADLRRFLDGQTTLAEEELARPASAPAAPVAPAAAATTVNPAVAVDPTPTTVAPAAAVAAEPVPADEEEPPARTGLFVAVTVLLLAALAALGFWLVTSLNDDGTNADQVLVTNVVGMTQDDATTALRAQGFNPQVKEEASDTEVAGQVFKQSPPPTKLTEGQGRPDLREQHRPRRGSRRAPSRQPRRGGGHEGAAGRQVHGQDRAVRVRRRRGHGRRDRPCRRHPRAGRQRDRAAHLGRSRLRHGSRRHGQVGGRRDEGTPGEGLRRRHDHDRGLAHRPEGHGDPHRSGGHRTEEVHDQPRRVQRRREGEDSGGEGPDARGGACAAREQGLRGRRREQVAARR